VNAVCLWSKLDAHSAALRLVDRIIKQLMVFVMQAISMMRLQTCRFDGEKEFSMVPDGRRRESAPIL
jgi:hypothetical protein